MNTVMQKPGVPSSSGRTGRRGLDIRLSVCLETGVPVPAASVDVARLDLQFLTDRPFRFGTVLRLALFTEPVTAVCYSRAVVHFCRATPTGWRIGAFLSQPLPGRLTDRISDDLRTQLRYECDWKAWLMWEQSGQLSPVHISSYSINGMRLSLDTQADPGSHFSLFSSAGAGDRTLIRGKVEWCRLIDGRYAAGCTVPGQRGRDLPRMFGNLQALHIDHAETSLPLPGGESLEMLLSTNSEPERFHSSLECT